MSDFAWKLRLFLSVDLVGSTAYKVAESKKEAPEWAHTFREFFRDFPLAIEREASLLAPPYPRCPESPRAWKFSGDEILFWVILTNHCETVTHLASCKRALRTFRCDWQQKTVPLGLKATAWLAGFPVTNSEVSVDAAGTSTIDFIGPSIDAGFRLTKYSQSRKFILAADLALMLLDAIHETEVPWADFHLFYDGKRVLKGVLDGTPYPIVWLDMDDGQQTEEEKLIGISRETKPHVLREHLARFVDNKMIRPFIAEEMGSKYGSVPAGLDRKREKMKALESQTSDTGRLDDQAGCDEPSIPPPELPGAKQGFFPGVPS